MTARSVPTTTRSEDMTRCGITELGHPGARDAGKTSLTERLLHAAGVIAAPGSVDDGSTQTDTLTLERRRGITIRSSASAPASG